MNKNTKEALEHWLNGAGPESENPYDNERFYNVVFESLKEGEILDLDDIVESVKENLSWTNEDFIQKFADETTIKIGAIFGFIEYLKNKKQINIYNKL